MCNWYPGVNKPLLSSSLSPHFNSPWRSILLHHLNHKSTPDLLSWWMLPVNSKNVVEYGAPLAQGYIQSHRKWGEWTVHVMCWRMFVVPICGQPVFDDVLLHSNIQISYHGDLCTSCLLTFVVSSNQPIWEEISSFLGILLDWILATTSSSPTHVQFMYITMRRYLMPFLTDHSDLRMYDYCTITTVNSHNA